MWLRTLNKWQNAADGDYVVIGDINLDYKHSNSPETNHINMVEWTKTELNRGFSQVIKEIPTPGEVSEIVSWTRCG